MLSGSSMLSGISVLGAALASWSGTDGIARLKCKKEQPPRPLIKSSGLDPVSILTHTFIANKISLKTFNEYEARIVFAEKKYCINLFTRLLKFHLK